MNDSHHLHALETTIQEAVSILPAEIQDLLAEQALSELTAAKQVAFTPVEDARHLDTLIASTTGKLRYLLGLDVIAQLKADLVQSIEIEKDNGVKEKVDIFERKEPTLSEILRAEKLISDSVKKYQTVLTDALRQRRLLSGQMFGTRMAHSSQVSRMSRVRQISMSGNQVLEDMRRASNTAIQASQDMERLPEKTNVVELFPSPAADFSDPTFEPVSDTPYTNPEIVDAVFTELAPRPKEKAKAKEPEDMLCTSFFD